MDSASSVEKHLLAGGRWPLIHPDRENIPSIAITSVSLLGKAAALRFLEWARQNPSGTASFCAGELYRYFVLWLTHFQRHWSASLAKAHGLEGATVPTFTALTFVQPSEFFPLSSRQHNSLHHFTLKNYLEPLGFPREKALTIDNDLFALPPGHTLDTLFPGGQIDLSLRNRQPKNRLEGLQKELLRQVDQFCMEYEDRIRALGGIGFFLGSLGVDGNVAFNVPGTGHYETTRLTLTNYEIEAQAAVDLGGMEVARGKPVITLGLSTLTCHPNPVILLLAPGETLSRAVKGAVESKKGILHPATAFQGIKTARIYLTLGAGRDLSARQTFDPERALINASITLKKPLLELTEGDLKTACAPGNPAIPLSSARKAGGDLKAKVQRGVELPDGKKFLHTEPHSDDIMLAYLPHILHLIRSPRNTHHFTCFTPGYNAVPNYYVLELLNLLDHFVSSEKFERLFRENYFSPGFPLGFQRDVSHYLDGIAQRSPWIREEAVSRRMLRALIQIFDETSLPEVKKRIRELSDYFVNRYPGQKDLPHVQRLKGLIRIWESECLWAFFGFNREAVHHLFLESYSQKPAEASKKIADDIQAVARHIESVDPDYVSLAFDPQGSGPDTHYRVMQIMKQALQAYWTKTRKSPKIWGYRNVWSRYHPGEVNLMIPVSNNNLAIMESAFLNCYVSQKNASFPSYAMDGPFCHLSQKIWVEQFRDVKFCLGRDFFLQNPHPRLRATHGLVFLKEMPLEEFFAHCDALKSALEEASDLPADIENHF